jgi:TolB-like protein/DNA-binding winged helix-turn-helix (wHTH) protein/Flp pilus assembly protein TadD
VNDTVVQPTYAFEGFRLDAQHRVLSRASGEAIPLAPKVFDTLLYFVERPGQLIAKRELLEAIWPHVVVEENNLNQAVSGVRRVLGETPGSHRFIVTEPGRGYRFVAAVTQISPPRDEAAAPRADETVVARAPAVKSRWPKYAAAAALAILALAGAWVWWANRDAPASSIATDTLARDAAAVRAVLPNSVAVLPLANLSPEPEQAAYADGMHAEIVHQLSKLRNVNVIAREAVLQNVGSPSPAQRARDLGVQSILTGTFQYVDGWIRVSVQLVDPNSNSNVWAQEYQERFEDVFAVQADIATRVAAALGAELSVAERRRMEMRPTTSGEAYATYLLALNHQNSDRRIDALRLLERAVEIDPTFSVAYGQLALLYALSMIDFIGGPAVSIAPSEVERRVSENARAALDLDPDSGAANTALAYLNGFFWRWSESDARFAAALASNPNDLELLNYYAIHLSSQGRYREALLMGERILELSPPSPDSLYSVWLAHVYSGNADAALDVLGKTLAMEPAQLPARINLGYVNARRGNSEEAARAFRRVEESTEGRRSPNLHAGLAYGYSRIGYTTEALRLFEELQNVAQVQSVGAGTWAIAYLAIGAEQQALEALDHLLKKIENHEPDPAWFNAMAIKHNVAGDPLLEEVRFKERRDRIRGT